MTNELEKRFFDTFGIEPKEFKYDIGIWNNELNCCEEHIITIPYVHYNNYSRCPSRDKGFIYPQITDRILLGLICIWNLYCTYTLIPTNYQNIKEYVLEQFLFIDTHNFIVDLPIVKHQVRTLFEEG